MKKILLSFLSALVLIFLFGCSNDKVAISNDYDNSNYTKINTDEQNQKKKVENIEDIDNNKNEYIVGPANMIEKDFSNIDELRLFYNKLEVEADTGFIIPDYSKLMDYKYYYFFKGVCNIDEYDKNPDCVEYGCFILGGEVYYNEIDGTKKSLYLFEILNNDILKYSTNYEIEYNVSANDKNTYYGYYEGEKVIKIIFLNEEINTIDLIEKTINEYSIIKKVN